MKPNEITGLVLVVVIHAVAVWDIVAYFWWGSEATVSIVMQAWSRSFPVLVLLTGLVLGHLFWPAGYYKPGSATPSEAGKLEIEEHNGGAKK